MYYIFESFFVGLYSSIIFLILNKTIKGEINLLIFLTGFAKHLFGMFLQIHTYYCNYGYACKKQSTGLLSSNYTHMLLVECILEGIVFVLFYNVIKRIHNLKTIYIIFDFNICICFFRQYKNIIGIS